MKAPNRSQLSKYEWPICLLVLALTYQATEASQNWLNQYTKVAHRLGVMRANTDVSVPTTLPQITLSDAEMPAVTEGAQSELRQAFMPPLRAQPVRQALSPRPSTKRREIHPLKAGYEPIRVTGLTDQGAFINGVYTRLKSPVGISYVFEGQEQRPFLEKISTTSGTVTIADTTGASIKITMESAR